MATQSETPRHVPALDIDIAAISARLGALADVALCPECQPTVTAIGADVLDLVAEVFRLYELAIVARRESANRLAAIRAALRAESDGIPEPLEFLRDEITDSAGGQLGGGTGRGWCR